MISIFCCINVFQVHVIDFYGTYNPQKDSFSSSPDKKKESNGSLLYCAVRGHSSMAPSTSRRPSRGCLNYCIIFIFLWLAASLFTLYFVFSPAQKSDASFHLRMNKIVPELVVPNPPTIAPSLHIFFTWPLHVQDFSYVNYKALESLLIAAPKNTSFQVLLPLTRYQYPHHRNYQSPLLFSTNHFLKYKKRGYNIEVIPSKLVNGFEDLEYWKEVEIYFQKSSNSFTPFHISFFLAINMLYQYGGLFTDFTFLFTSKFIDDLDTISSSYYLNTFCQGQICFTSSLLHFPTNSPLLLCMLKAYSEEKFTTCLFSQTSYQGASCIDKTLRKCFLRLKTNNLLSDSSISNYIITFENDASKAFEFMVSSNFSVIDSLVLSSSYWLGTTAINSGNFDLPVNSFLSSIVSIYSTLLDSSIASSFPSTSSLCSHYRYNNNTPVVPNNAIFTRSCSPSFIIPEFARTSSIYFSTLLSSHPQILSSLDSSCYAILRDEKRYQSRHLCSPFIEASEPFVSMDASSVYTTDFDAPLLALQDNPELKVIYELL